MPAKTPAKKAAKPAAPKGNILEYLEEPPSPYKEMAVYNYHKLCPNKNKVVRDIYDSVDSAFPWNKTEQGFSFWSSVQDAAEDKRYSYPEIPDTTKAKIWSGVVPDYTIVVDKKKSKVIVGCQEIDLDTFKQFVQEFNEFIE